MVGYSICAKKAPKVPHLRLFCPKMGRNEVKVLRKGHIHWILGSHRNTPIYAAVCRDMGFNPLPSYLTDTLYEGELDVMRRYMGYGLAVLSPTAADVVKNTYS